MVDFQATCPTGLEDLLADELRALGAGQVRPLKGQVAFSGTLETGLSACVRSHLASRIILVLARVDAPDADALYTSLREIAWEDQIDPRTSFMVDAHGTNERLKNTQFIAERSKDRENIKRAKKRAAVPDPPSTASGPAPWCRCASAGTALRWVSCSRAADRCSRAGWGAASRASGAITLPR